MATIESNFESICINPNDDLVLYKKEIIRSRIEKFLYAICSLDTDDLPTPLSRIEELYNCLVTGEDIPTFTPLSRAEKFVMAMLGAYDVELLPTPISRSETLMKKIATGDNNLDDVDNLQSRYEFLLAYIIKAGGFNGGSGDFYYVNYPINSSVITLYNTFERPVKSAILKGQTLANMSSLTGVTTLKPGDVIFIENTGIKINTTYTIMFNCSNVPSTNFVEIKTMMDNTQITQVQQNVSVGYNKFTIRTHTSKETNRFRFKNDTSSSTDFIFSELLILEGDYTNENIPYFEGMASVKMPVLKTVGKNLYNKTPFNGFIDSANGKFIYNNSTTRKISDYIEVKPNTTYKVSGCTMTAMWGYDKDKNPISAINIYTDYITTTNDMRFIAFNINAEVEHSNIQIEEGTVATQYEPHKSNILTCNEEVELRGIGDIKDELDLMSGELTQRIGEITLNGDENWALYASQPNQVNTIAFKLSHTNHSSSWSTGLGYCDKMIFTNGDVIYGQDSEGVTTDTNNIIVRISNSKVTSVDEFKGWLSNNNLRVVYPLKEEIVKTVDLSILNQDNKETKLTTFDDITHVIVSSEGLIPEGEIDIARPIQFVDYSLDNGWTTLYNTIEYPVKNAVLKGQTLKNITDYNIEADNNVTIEADGTITITAKGKYTEVFLPALEKLPSTKYWVGINVIENTLNGDFVFHATTGVNCIFAYSGTIIQGFVGVKEQVRTTMTDVSSAVYAFRSYLGSKVTEGIIKYKVMAIPYQEGMENWGIPYFEGMASVKMPVLTTTGKNLVGKLVYGSVAHGGKIADNKGQLRVRTDYINIQNEENITLKAHSEEVNCSISFFYDENKKFISQIAWSADIAKSNGVTISIPLNTKYIICEFSHNMPSDKDLVLSNIKVQIEKGDTATFYESFKTNILTCNEEVKLRGIGNIKDELNLTTGELTQRIGEFVLDGSSDELWDIVTNNSGFKRFVSRVKKTHSNYLEITNWLPTTNKSYWSINENGFYIGSNGEPVIVFNTNDSRYNMSITEFENYLSQNPLIVQYPLIESVKTVDLSVVNQDDVLLISENGDYIITENGEYINISTQSKETKLTTFDDITHVTVSSEGLIPTGEITVATKDATDVIDAGVMSLRMNDILNSQGTLEGSANAQSDDIDVTMLGTTDIYEQLL